MAVNDILKRADEIVQSRRGNGYGSFSSFANAPGAFELRGGAPPPNIRPTNSAIGVLGTGIPPEQASGGGFKLFADDFWRPLGGRKPTGQAQAAPIPQGQPQPQPQPRSAIPIQSSPQNRKGSRKHIAAKPAEGAGFQGETDNTLPPGYRDALGMEAPVAANPTTGMDWKDALNYAMGQLSNRSWVNLGRSGKKGVNAAGELQAILQPAMQGYGSELKAMSDYTTADQQNQSAFGANKMGALGKAVETDQERQEAEMANKLGYAQLAEQKRQNQQANALGWYNAKRGGASSGSSTNGGNDLVKLAGDASSKAYIAHLTANPGDFDGASRAGYGAATGIINVVKGNSYQPGTPAIKGGMFRKDTPATEGHWKTNQAPPVAGAQQAPDGNWYVVKKGKYYRVD